MEIKYSSIEKVTEIPDNCVVTIRTQVESEDALAEARKIASTLRSQGAGLVLIMDKASHNPTLDIESLDEEAMRRLGWVRAASP